MKLSIRLSLLLFLSDILIMITEAHFFDPKGDHSNFGSKDEQRECVWFTLFLSVLANFYKDT